MPDKPFKRILLKLSGESLKGDRGHGIDPASLDYMAEEIKTVTSKGIELGIVVGGARALQDSLERKHKLDTRTLSAINIQQVAEPYIRRRAIRHLEKGRIVLFAAGTGNPFVTTDTGSALRALEIEADVLLMAKNDVDGVYNKDPKLDKSAVKYESISYIDAIEKRLKVMDSTALSLCMEYSIPIVVFDLFEKGNLNRIVTGEKVGTLVTGE